MSSEKEVQEIWKRVDCVCFDVDSTICTNEAIDELAKFCNVGDKVEELTLQAMSGGMTFREALRVRLQIIKPSQKILEKFVQTQNDKLTQGAKELVTHLQSKQIPVYLISGGFRFIISHVARALNIDHEHVFANTILFDSNGDYKGFDESEPTSESNGKGQVIGMLKEKYKYKNLVMIGDGATDLETYPPADAFIGFGQNVVREKVRQKSKWFVMHFQELIDKLV